MNAIPFDTLKLSERLQAGGFTPEQARAAASALADVATTAAHTVTKDHLDARLAEIKADLLKRIVAAIGLQTLVILGAILGLAPLIFR